MTEETKLVFIQLGNAITQLEQVTKASIDPMR